MMPHVLLVDDERNIRFSLRLILEGEGFAVREAASGEDALFALQKEPVDLVFLDLNLPGIDGLETLRRLRVHHAQLAIIMISGQATVEKAVEATRLGAYDFLEKPFSRDRVLLLARNATDHGRLRAENARLRGSSDEILGESEAIVALRATIAKVAPTQARVLIRGESGTGKELVAMALHRGSARADRAFVRVNCAAIPEELIEAELFGAEKGAYTGAQAKREGRFAVADGGTLLLDEIGDMSLRAQIKVLRVLQEGEFQPVGSSKTQRVDVRVFAATHQDLEQAVREGRFREDLLYRLNVIPIDVPALRNRPGDVAILTGAFLREYARRHECSLPLLSAAAEKLLAAHSWPGNIRELRNVIERLVILSSDGRIDADDLPAELRDVQITRSSQGGAANPYAALPLREAKAALERDLIRLALQAHENNVTRAAAALGLERTHLHKRLKALGLLS